MRVLVDVSDIKVGQYYLCTKILVHLLSFDARVGMFTARYCCRLDSNWSISYYLDKDLRTWIYRDHPKLISEDQAYAVRSLGWIGVQ